MKNPDTLSTRDVENTATHPQSAQQPSMLAVVWDLPNLFTLAGLLSGVLGIYFAIRGNFSATMIAMLWALFFDWFDGLIARTQRNRSQNLRNVGGQLDSLVDIISAGVCPAVVLLSYGEFSPWFLPGAMVLIAAGVIRLSYFNVFCLGKDSPYLGLTIDNNIIVVPLVFLLEGVVSQAVFAATLYCTIVILAILNVTPFQMPKLGGRWYYIITTYAVGLTAVYGWRIWREPF